MAHIAPECIISEPALLIRISRLYRPGMSARELYDATRGIWRLGARRQGAKLALAVYQGTVVEVYEIQAWHPAGTTPYANANTDGFDKTGRWEFVGDVARDEVRARYVGASVAHYFARGSQNPVLYVNVPTIVAPTSPNQQKTPPRPHIVTPAPRSAPPTLSVEQLAALRRDLVGVLNAVDPTKRPYDEGIGKRISRLATERIIPREIAALMRVVTEMRNQAEYESKVLSAPESTAVSSAWAAIRNWAESLSPKK